MKINQKQILIIVGTIATFLFGIVFLMYQKGSNEEELLWETVESNVSSVTESTDLAQEDLVILVDIKGEIKQPGVYELAHDARLNELILLAGGFTENAEVRQINLAEKLSDQQMIYVPNQDELTFSIDQLVEDEEDMSQSSTTVNINTADLTELQQLPGVGPSKAQAIIAYREENGLFKSIEGLLEVSGFGEKTFEKLKDSIVI
ncbi:helix-hairpin-helix domain-containing protein [Enterococcus eurekensis]|uniref:Helix-hairpin-helix domain-containing protein n=1 Tax=Enterococcus eurekensis TaxID=1159753 RepID=A0ABV9M1E7_9ENTE